MPRPIDHARAVIEARRTGQPLPPDTLAWAADGLARHVERGVSLPHALGLVRHGGGGGHALTARRNARDDMVRELHRRWFVDLAPAPAAGAILQALHRQARARGRVADDMGRALEALLGFDPPLPESVRQLRRILAFNSPFQWPRQPGSSAA